MKQIIALGGGGFSMEPENTLLDSYILKLSNKERPKICFIPTASGDSEDYISRFYQFFEKMNCEPSHLSLFVPPTRDLEGYILEKDIIYVGGGSTKNLVALWKEWGLDSILKKAWSQEIIIAGISAGAICWFEEGVTGSFGGMDPIGALGFLKGSYCPHYDGEVDRRPAYRKLIEEKEIIPGYAVDDGAALHFIDDKLYQVVTSRPNAKAYRVFLEDGVIEEELEKKYLGEE
ncbi:peptidase E [Robertmurraya yapensis]|uniref:Peptidase E n=2 Tax=Bacillaceae TaxID=186817 RepID=A0A431WKG3_9BACI|nr:peptidase E [Bacillus yapensis]RTR35843.1 peptidase E [Bacillus yapensis]TKS98645.1 peptidase E [Bacillus yapensis]